MVRGSLEGLGQLGRAWCFHISSGIVGKLPASLDLLTVRLAELWVSLVGVG